MRYLTIHKAIDCGETTCASKPGEFCEHLRYDIVNDQKADCMLFNMPLRVVDGWVQRHRDCLRAEDR